MTRNEAIIADVWVYNRSPAPDQPDWENGPEGAPFLNPRAFVRADVSFELPASAKDVSFQWRDCGSSRVVAIFLRGRLAAEVGPELCPGRAVLAKRAGPLAQPLESSIA